MRVEALGVLYRWWSRHWVVAVSGSPVSGMMSLGENELGLSEAGSSDSPESRR